MNFYVSNPYNFYKVIILEGEPTKLQCFTCSDEFTDSWSLLSHLSTVHKLSLYKESTLDAEAQGSGTELTEQVDEGEHANGGDDNNVELKSDNGENPN